MMELGRYRHKRWVWTPTEQVDGFDHPLPVAREYAWPWVAPMANRDFELMMGFFSQMQLKAIRRDHRIIILDGIHSHKPIPPAVAEGMAEFGVTADMTVAEMLHHLGEHVDPQFYPEH